MGGGKVRGGGEKREGGRKKKKASRACALAVAPLSRGLGGCLTPHLAPRGAPQTWPGERARRAPVQAPGPGGRLRTRVPDPRAAGLLEVERGEGARLAAAVTARAWSRGRWSPPSPPFPPCSLSGRAGGFHERPAETEGERERGGEEEESGSRSWGALLRHR